MNANDNNLRDELGRSLHQQADHIGGTPISFEQVKHTAGRIRRRRAITASAAVAAAVAIIVPTAMFTANLGPDAAPDKPPVATQSSDPTPTDPTPTDPATTAVPLPDEIPHVGWFKRSTMEIVMPDGSLDALDRADYDQFAVIGETLLASRPDGNGNGFLDVIVDGEVTETLETNGTLVVSADGTIAAWADRDGMVFAQYAGGSTWEADRVGFGGDGGYYPTAVSGNGSCKETDVVGEGVGGCTVYVAQGGEASGLALNSHGNGEMPPGLASVRDVWWSADRSRGLLSGLREGSPEGVANPDPWCSVLVDPADNREVLEDCTKRLETISPDGRHVLAVDIDSDGYGPLTYYVIDTTTGKVVTTVEDRGTLFNAVWEDDGHVLFLTVRDGMWSVIRVGLDGSVETALPAVAGDEFEPAYVLPKRP